MLVGRNGFLVYELSRLEALSHQWRGARRECSWPVYRRQPVPRGNSMPCTVPWRHQATTLGPRDQVILLQSTRLACSRHCHGWLWNHSTSEAPGETFLFQIFCQKLDHEKKQTLKQESLKGTKTKRLPAFVLVKRLGMGLEKCSYYQIHNVRSIKAKDEHPWCQH